MFKINGTQYVEKKRFYHRVFRSSLYKLDPAGEPPCITGFNDQISCPGALAVMMSSHEFLYDKLMED